MVAGGRRQKAEADPPFDFAQGRLCGDDNQRCNGKASADASTTAKCNNRSPAGMTTKKAKAQFVVRE